jgi:sec-independent protein translocase protein TatB
VEALEGVMIGFSEVMLVLVFATLVLGPERMPGVIRSWARTVAAWRAELQGAAAELRTVADGIEETASDVAHELSMPELRRELDEVRAELAALRGERDTRKPLRTDTPEALAAETPAPAPEAGAGVEAGAIWDASQTAEQPIGSAPQ